MSDHLPLRPSWECMVCGDEWPCPPRRQQLLAEYKNAPLSLRLHMMKLRDDAAVDLGVDPDKINDRFVKDWVPHNWVGWE